MSLIADTFARLKKEKRSAFMPFLVAGDPNLAATGRLIQALAEAGADLIELGIPFSDPSADGPVIQRAGQRALQSKTTVAKVLAMVRSVRKTVRIPILLMGYYNPFLRYGLARLCADAAAAGANGFIIPDLAPDDAAEIRPFAKRHGLDTVFLIAPTSTEARLRLVARESRGFVYAVSLTGVTGERKGLPPDLAKFLRRARKSIRLPLAVGFGIGTPAAAANVARDAEGVIVGSAIVRRIEDALRAGKDPVPGVRRFAAGIVTALRPAKPSRRNG